MKAFLAISLVVLTWVNSSRIATGIVVETLSGGNWVEAARLPPTAMSWSDGGQEGVYRVRAFYKCPVSGIGSTESGAPVECAPNGEVFSLPATGALLLAPVSLTVK